MNDVGGLYGRREAGSFLRERLYGLGSLYPWDEIVQRATGQAIGVDAYAGEWFE